MTLPSDTGATNESGREPRRNEVLQRVTALIGEHGYTEDEYRRFLRDKMRLG